MQLGMFNADCFNMWGGYADKSIDMVLTDIPYGEVNRKDNGLRNLDKGIADKCEFEISDLMGELLRVTRGSIYIFCGTEQVSEIRTLMTNSGMSTRLLIWEKTNPSPMNGDKIWLSGIECCVYGKYPGAVFNEHCKNTVFRYPTGESEVHPTQKPVGLMERLISASTLKGDIVLDPFMGSGTTCIACERLGRKYIGIEKDKHYYELALKRMEEETAQIKFDI